jgi:hypothetical protein
MDLSLRDENEIVLRDGSTAHVRTTSPDDAELLRDLLERLSPDALWLRFLRAGVSSPIATVFAHVAYGAIVGGSASLAG